MATELDNGVRSLQIKFSSGSMTVGAIKEATTMAQLKTFAQAIGLFTTKKVTGITVNDKESAEFEDDD